MKRRHPPTVVSVSRRELIAAGLCAGSGLILGLPVAAAFERERSSERAALRPNAFLSIAATGKITIVIPSCEMGQGVTTSLPMIMAEELDAAWQDVVVVQAPVADEYRNPIQNAQGTWGSNSVRGFYMPFRIAGATARDMLLRAAATRWRASMQDCQTHMGVVTCADGRSLGYGELAESAARIKPRPDVPLKTPSEFRIIGSNIAGKDIPAKIDGSAIFGIDVELPQMLHAAVRQSPAFGAKLREYNRQQVLSKPGVVSIVRVSNALVVVADSFWHAKRAADALEPVFDSTPAAAFSDAKIRSDLERAVRLPGTVAHQHGDVESAFRHAENFTSATYETPFLAHMTLEPMNCTAFVQGDRCHIWAGLQTPELVRTSTAKALGIPPENVSIHQTFMGGGFGRRGGGDYVQQAVSASQVVGRPVKLIWERADDVQHDEYRHAAIAMLRGALDRYGRIQALDCHIAMKPFRHDSQPDWYIRGIGDQGYRLTNSRISFSAVDHPVPVGYWRSTTYSNNTFAMESFIDELSHADQCDPLAFRMRLLEGEPRMILVLKLASEAANWPDAQSPDHALGIAVAQHRGSFAALVAEVTLSDSRLNVTRMSCAADCGTIIHPLSLEGQITSAIADGVSSSLHGKINLRDGAVVQSNFHDYPVMRMSEMPQVTVRLVDSELPPGGAGELATPLVAPAIANALFRLTGRRIRRLPLQDQL